MKMKGHNYRNFFSTIFLLIISCISYSSFYLENFREKNEDPFSQHMCPCSFSAVLLLEGLSFLHPQDEVFSKCLSKYDCRCPMFRHHRDPNVSSLSTKNFPSPKRQHVNRLSLY